MSDLLEIQAVLARYARGLDVRDFDMVGRCFASDAQAEYGGQQLRGVEEIVRYVRRVERFRATTHVMTNVVVDVAGDVAQARSQAIAYLIAPEAEADSVRIRGIRYDDELGKRAGTWVILKRLHRADWSVSLSSANVQVPPPR